MAIVSRYRLKQGYRRCTMLMMMLACHPCLPVQRTLPLGLPVAAGTTQGWDDCAPHGESPPPLAPFDYLRGRCECADWSDRGIATEARGRAGSACTDTGSLGSGAVLPPTFVRLEVQREDVRLAPDVPTRAPGSNSVTTTVGFDTRFF